MRAHYFTASLALFPPEILRRICSNHTWHAVTYPHMYFADVRPCFEPLMTPAGAHPSAGVAQAPEELDGERVARVPIALRGVK